MCQEELFKKRLDMYAQIDQDISSLMDTMTTSSSTHLHAESQCKLLQLNCSMEKLVNSLESCKQKLAVSSINDPKAQILFNICAVLSTQQFSSYVEELVQISSEELSILNIASTRGILHDIDKQLISKVCTPLSDSEYPPLPSSIPAKPTSHHHCSTTWSRLSQLKDKSRQILFRAVCKKWKMIESILKSMEFSGPISVHPFELAAVPLTQATDKASTPSNRAVCVRLYMCFMYACVLGVWRS